MLRRLRMKPLRNAWRVFGGDDVEITGEVWLPGPGIVRIGRGVRLLARSGPIELRAHAGGEIRIDDGVVIESGASIEATQLVHVGAGARIGRFAKILDNHFHRMVGDRFERPESVPIVIGPNALVGPRAILLPGAELGAGARIGAAMVLSFRVPAGLELPARKRDDRDDHAESAEHSRSPLHEQGPESRRETGRVA